MTEIPKLEKQSLACAQVHASDWPSFQMGWEAAEAEQKARDKALAEKLVCRAYEDVNDGDEFCGEVNKGIDAMRCGCENCSVWRVLSEAMRGPSRSGEMGEKKEEARKK